MEPVQMRNGHSVNEEAKNGAVTKYFAGFRVEMYCPGWSGTGRLKVG
jgi:hypothetical protein